MKIDGGCQCGHITYEAVGDPETVSVCHCTDCQKFSGGAFRVGILAPEKSFRLLSGTLKIYVKTAESGGKREQVFCPECGTHLYSTSVGATGDEGAREFRIRVPTTRQCNELVPKRQGWMRSAQRWLGDLATIPGSETAWRP